MRIINSEEARAAAKKHIEAEYGESYYENRYYKTKADAQDAHAAIRPTYVELSPEKVHLWCKKWCLHH